MNYGNCGICGKQITSKQVIELYKGKAIYLKGIKVKLEHLKL